MQRTGEEEVVFCDACGTNSAVSEANKIDREMSATSFTQEVTTKSAEDAVDLVLVAQRHLFRAPYSLHEKTALASIVLDKSEIEDFTPSDADPLKIHNPKSFMPNPLPGEAKDLLFEALDNVKEETRERKKYDGAPLDLKGLTITEDMFPPIIKKLQKGIQGDGRKRALYILLSFYNALEFPQEFIEEKIFAWNKKNKLPLKEGYVVSQVSWFSKRKILPPNYTNPMYKVFGTSGKEESGIKNPITYTIKKAMRGKAKEGMKNENKPDNLF